MLFLAELLLMSFWFLGNKRRWRIFILVIFLPVSIIMFMTANGKDSDAIDKMVIIFLISLTVTYILYLAGNFLIDCKDIVLEWRNNGRATKDNRDGLVRSFEDTRNLEDWKNKLLAETTENELRQKLAWDRANMRFVDFAISELYETLPKNLHQRLSLILDESLKIATIEIQNKIEKRVVIIRKSDVAWIYEVCDSAEFLKFNEETLKAWLGKYIANHLFD